MENIVNNPGSTDDSAAGIVVGVIIVLLIALMFFMFALPYIRTTGARGAPSTGSTGGDTSININLPETTTSPSPTSSVLSPSGSNGY